MKNTHENSQSTWSADAKKTDYPILDESLETDIAVIGGGITGILTAYLLNKAGKRVVILEKGHIGRGASGLTTAFLTASIDTDFKDLIKSFGPANAREIIMSHLKAISLIEKIVTDEKIECGFARCSNYIYASNEKSFADLDEESDAANALGLDTMLEKDGARLGFKNHGYIEVRNQAKFHPLEFITKLSEILSKRGVLIFEKTEALEILDRSFGSSVRARGHSIQARFVISAAYEPFGQPSKLYFKKGMYKTYVLEALTEWKIPEGTYEDTQNPYHYMRVDKNGSGYRLLVGGEDHREDIPIDEVRGLNALEKYLESIIPKESFTVVRTWTGPILEPVDGVPYIGEMKGKPNCIYAFAFSGNGMTYAAIAAEMMRDKVMGKKNSLFNIYRTRRLPHIRAFFTKGLDFTEELFRGAVKNVASTSKKLSSKLPRRNKKK